MDWSSATARSACGGQKTPVVRRCRTNGRAPVCRDVREWGAQTVLVQEGGHKGCSLMDSDWKSGREAGRSEGTYTVSRLLRLQRQHCSSAPASPILILMNAWKN